MDEAFAREYPDLAERHFWWRARSKLVRRLIEAEPEPRSILDVGCGSGAVLRQVADLGWVEGVEVDPTTVRADTAMTQHIQIGRIDEVELRRSSYSIVLLLDVLEHVEDRIELLGAIRSRLDSEGTLILTVPAHQWLWTSHDEVNRHWLRYSRHGLHRDLETAGFTVDLTRYLFGWLIVPKMLVALAERIARRPIRSVAGVPPDSLNRFLETLSDREMAIALGRGIPTGTSILAIARPSRVTAANTNTRSPTG